MAQLYTKSVAMGPDGLVGGLTAAKIKFLFAANCTMPPDTVDSSAIFGSYEWIFEIPCTTEPSGELRIIFGIVNN